MKHEIYKRNFLDRVIFRIDFVNSFNVDEFIENNLAKLKKIYPLYSPIPIKHNNIKIKLDKDKGSTVEQESLQQTKQQFFNKENTARMEITSKSLIISYKKYNSFRELRSDIKAVLEIIKSNVNLIVGRTGLRYVNIFQNNDLEPIDWTKYIKETLISKEKWDDYNVLQSMSVVNLKNDDALIKVQYGLFNGDMPNDRVKDCFILDIDACSFEVSELEKIESQVEKWNQYIRSIFEVAITEEMKQVLNNEQQRL